MKEQIYLNERDTLSIIRRKKGIKVKEIAHHVGCSSAMISYFESGKRNFKEEKFKLYKQYILDK